MLENSDTNTSEIGTDEQFDAFMKWAMTNGSDMFSSAANDYVNGGDESKLYVLSTYYAKEFGLNQSVALNIAKEAAEGIYGFLGGMQIIDTRNANESMNTNMNTINEWSPYPKNNDWRKNAEKAKNVPNPEPNDGKKGWGVKTNKKKDGDWYKNESRNMNEEENWQDAYSDGKKITQSRRINGSKQYRTVDVPKKQSKFKPTKYTGSPKDGSWYKNESVVPKTLIRLTESDLHRIVKESVNRILRETHNEWDELADIRWRNRDYRNNSDEAQRVGKVRGDALANWHKWVKDSEKNVSEGISLGETENIMAFDVFTENLEWSNRNGLLMATLYDRDDRPVGRLNDLHFKYDAQINDFI